MLIMLPSYIYIYTFLNILIYTYIYLYFTFFNTYSNFRLSIHTVIYTVIFKYLHTFTNILLLYYTFLVNNNVFHLDLGDQSIIEPKAVNMILANYNPIDVSYIITNTTYPLCICHDGFWATKAKRLRNQPSDG